MGRCPRLVWVAPLARGKGASAEGGVSAIVEGVGCVYGVSFEAAGRREVGGGLRWWTWWVELYGTTNFTNGHEWVG